MIIENTIFPESGINDGNKDMVNKILEIKKEILNSTYSNLFSHADLAISNLHRLIDQSPSNEICSFIAKLLMPVSQLLRIIKVFELHVSETSKNEFSADVVYSHDDLNRPIIICRICEKPVLESNFEEHTKQCIEAYHSAHLVSQIDVEIKEINQCFLNMVKIPWPAPVQQTLNILIPIHSVVLLNKLNDNFPSYEIFSHTCSCLLSTFNVIENYVTTTKLLNLIGRAKNVIKKKAKDSLTSFLLLNMAHKTTLDHGAPLSPSNSFTGFQDVNIASFLFIDFISRGSSARVFRCKRRTTGDEFAIKVVPKSYLQKGNNKYHILHEKDLLFRMTSDRVAKVYFSFLGVKNLYIVMDYFSGGDLGKRLSFLGSLPEDTARKCAAQIVLMLEDLRSKGIVHRDLKPQNILIDHSGKLQLIDFGLSEGGFDERQLDNSDYFGGTAGYMPPEAQYGQTISYTGDYWSLGCMIYEFLYGVPPFNKDHEHDTLVASLHNEVQFIDDEDFQWPELAKDLIRRLLDKDPNKRIGRDSIEEIKEHEWFKSIDWKHVPNVPEIPEVDPRENSEPFDFNSKQFEDIRADIDEANRLSSKSSSEIALTTFDDMSDELSDFVQVSGTAPMDLQLKAVGKDDTKSKFIKFQNSLPLIPLNDDSRTDELSKLNFVPPKSRTPLTGMKSPFS